MTADELIDKLESLKEKLSQSSSIEWWGIEIGCRLVQIF
jgi:hypothetical protein